jgi:hypothetical protein
MWQKRNMHGFGGSSVGGCNTRIDDSPPSLSSFDMLKEHPSKLKELQNL